MTKDEYTEQVISINAGVLDRLITIVGNAMPHTVPQLTDLLTTWSKTVKQLDAEYESSLKQPEERCDNCGLSCAPGNCIYTPAQPYTPL